MLLCTKKIKETHSFLFFVEGGECVRNLVLHYLVVLCHESHIHFVAPHHAASRRLARTVWTAHHKSTQSGVTTSTCRETSSAACQSAEVRRCVRVRLVLSYAPPEPSWYCYGLTRGHSPRTSVLVIRVRAVE